MMDKLNWGRWHSLVATVGDSRNLPQVLWALRLFIASLALLAAIYAIIHFVSLLGGSAATGSQAASVVATSVNPAAGLDASAVKAWGWYSDPQAADVDAASAAAAVAAENLKKTRLQMRLEGIVKADEEKESVAIIAIEKKSKQYKTGAKLPVAPGVFLRTIDVDRIILDNNGSLEELLLFSKDLTQQRRATVEEPAQSGGVLDQSSNEQITQMLGRYRDQIQQNPASINELIRFSAHSEDGKLTGFKVGAANNSQDFRQLGLESGDVITHVNGVDLSDYRKALNLYKDMGDLSEVRVQLLRGGQPQELIFRLPDEG